MSDTVVDVIIPVYNAPELTRRCIESVVTRLGTSIRTIHIQNDASDVATYAMLESLSYPQLKIFHAPKNQGYGKSVNDAMTRTNADLALVLNSDCEVLDNFLPLLCVALDTDPQLAVICPTEGKMPHGKADRYLRQPGGYIVSYRFRGYAFLIRRTVFQALGGFDAQFGRGYYEDTDLGRRLEQQGWRMGVHPDAAVCHATGASFGRGQSYRDLVRKNRNLYFSRYPQARQNILAVSGACTLAGLPAPLADALEQVMRQGGRLQWLTPQWLPRLSCLQMRNNKIGLRTVMQSLMRGWSRKDKRITDIWILPGTTIWLRVLLQTWARMCNIRIREWETATF